MARTARVDVGDVPYHVLNRAVGKLQIFDIPKDYQTFIEILADAKEETNMLLSTVRREGRPRKETE